MMYLLMHIQAAASLGHVINLLLQSVLCAAQVLAAMPHGAVAFYNCGEHSGRSQPHKHLQVRCCRELSASILQAG
jgi:hypothetical protein